MAGAIMKLFVLTFTFVFLVGCNSSAGDKSQAPQNTKPVCGSWFSNECTCAKGLYLFENGDDKRCLDLKATNFCLENKNGFQIALGLKDSTVFDDCISFPVSKAKTLPLQSIDIHIALYDVPLAEKKKFAMWADAHTDLLKSMDSWVTASSTSGEFLNVTSNITPFLKDMLNPYLMPVYTVDYIQSFLSPKIFSDVDGLIEYLEEPQRKSKMDTARFRFDNRALALAHFYNSDWQAKERKVAYVNSVQECAGSCLRESEPESFHNYQFVVREYVVEDKAFRTEIIMFDEGRSVVGTLYLAQAKVSTLFLIDRDNGGLEAGISAYTVNGEKIHETPAKVSMSAGALMKQRAEWMQTTQGPDYQIAVCETEFRFEEFRKRGIESHLQFGPHLSASYFGWVESPINNQQFWQGQVFMNPLGLSFSNFFYADHAANVSNVLVTNPSGYHVGVIPMGIDECLDAKYMAESWRSVRAQTNVRVVNLSVTDQVDEPTCQKLMEAHPVTGDDDVLWIMGAGNAGSDVNLNCPQFFAGQDNVIIVGASNNGYMESYSNRGQWVDIAASGFGKDGGSSSDGAGTSYAAPRVSRLAGKIFFFYPKLTALQVKLAILLGSKYVGDYFPVRSRGELSDERAMRYAEKFHNKVDIKDAILQIECGSQWWCSAAEKKSILLETID